MKHEACIKSARQYFGAAHIDKPRGVALN